MRNVCTHIQTHKTNDKCTINTRTSNKNNQRMRITNKKLANHKHMLDSTHLCRNQDVTLTTPVRNTRKLHNALQYLFTFMLEHTCDCNTQMFIFRLDNVCIECYKNISDSRTSPVPPAALPATCCLASSCSCACCGTMNKNTWKRCGDRAATKTQTIFAEPKKPHTTNPMHSQRPT